MHFPLRNNNNMARLFSLSSIVLLMFSTSMFAQKSKDDKEKRYSQVIEIIESGSYSFIADFAFPQKGRQISLISNPNYFTVHESSVKAEMPYFGVSRSGAAGYGSTGGGIIVEAQLEELKVDKNDKKRRVVVKFRVRAGSELLNCTFTVNSPQSASLVINSSMRDTIRYSGKLSAEK